MRARFGWSSALASFVSTLLSILAPLLTSMIGFALIGLFLWKGALLFLLGVSALGYLGMKRHFKHQQPEAFDDKQWDNIEQAIVRYIEEVKRKNDAKN